MFDIFLFLQEMEDKEEAMHDVKVENTDQSAFCDLRFIEPGVIRKAETKLSALEMSKILLERMLVRKELKLIMLQQRLIEQAQKLEEVEQKLKAYKNMREAFRCSCQPALEDVSIQTGSVRTRAVPAGAVRNGAGRALSWILGLISYRRLLTITCQCLHNLMSITARKISASADGGPRSPSAHA